MLFFLGCCFIFMVWCTLDIRINSQAKLLGFLYIAGIILLDLAILALMALVWGAEHGKW